MAINVTPRRILVVDDDHDNRRLVAATLQHEGYHVETAADGSEALLKVDRFLPELLLLDINMPGMSGIEVLRKLRLRQQYVSVIFVTARSETNDVILGLDAGADDYIRKPFDPYELLARVRAKLRIKDLNDQLTAANRKLEELIDIDDLTQLFNMRSIYPKIDKEIKRAQRYNRSVAVVMMDMDNFKNVNDTHDHLFGSFVLSSVGQLIRQNIRDADFAARYGGDEFLIVLVETNADGAERFSERLRKVVQDYTFATKDCSMKLSASLGVAVMDQRTPDVDARTLVRVADNLLYEAKYAGKNCVRVVEMFEALKTKQMGKRVG